MNTFAKLRDGKWGVKTDQSYTEGQEIEITQKNGIVKKRHVANFLWSGEGKFLYALYPAGQLPLAKQEEIND